VHRAGTTLQRDRKAKRIIGNLSVVTGKTLLPYEKEALP